MLSKNIIKLTDSRAIIKAIVKFENTKHKELKVIHSMIKIIQVPRNILHFNKSPSHAGIVRNEEADYLAERYNIAPNQNHT